LTYEHINPEELGAPRGWTNGMLGPVGGRILFVAGQDAAEPEGVVTEEDFVEQFGIALGKAVTVVREAGGGPEDVGRLTIFVGPNLDTARRCYPSFHVHCLPPIGPSHVAKRTRYQEHKLRVARVQHATSS